MFNGCYDKTDAIDRPKYGCLNIAGDVEGCVQARYYGVCVMILKPHVRQRCTFFSQDSCDFKKKSDCLATAEYYAHVLHQYSDDELKSLLTVCKDARIRGCVCTAESYKEVQIHGPLSLERDVQALSLPGRKQTANHALLHNAIKFQYKAQCNVLWQEDILDNQ